MFEGPGKSSAPRAASRETDTNKETQKGALARVFFCEKRREKIELSRFLREGPHCEPEHAQYSDRAPELHMPDYTVRYFTPAVSLAVRYCHSVGK
jgi:hypothetical protein